MSEEETPNTPDEEPVETELPEIDYTDPLKRDDDEEMPGLDPVVTIPPDSRFGSMVSPYMVSCPGRRSGQGGQLHG